MNDIDLEGIFKAFPRAVGVLRCGSAAYNKKDRFSDIDLIIIDQQFGVVGTSYLNTSRFVYDVTQVPLGNLMNVLTDESLDSKGGLISMLAGSHFLSGSDEKLCKNIIKEAIEIYQNGFFPGNFVRHNFLREIKNLSIEISREHTELAEKLLHHEIIHYVTNNELIQTKKWLPTGKHKIRELSDNKKIYKLIELIEDVTKKENTLKETRKEFLINYLENYVTESRSNGHLNTITNRIIIDFEYNNWNYKSFQKKILPSILENDFLNKLFIGYSLTPEEYVRVYKHKTLFLFKIEQNDQQQEIINCLKAIILKNGYINPSFSYLPTILYQSQHPNHISLYLFEPVIKELNFITLSRLNLNEEKYDEDCMWLLVLLIANISRRLDLGLEDFVNLNNYAQQKYLYNSGEQYNRQSAADLDFIRIAKYNYCLEFYKENKESAWDFFNTGINTVADLSGRKIYAKALLEIKFFLEVDYHQSEAFFERNKITCDVLASHYNIKDIKNGLLYVMTINYLTQFFGVSRLKNILAFFICNAIIREKFAIVQNNT